MYTSARNQLAGTVAGIQRGAVNDEVRIDLDDGQAIVAILTHGSVESLSLQPGSKAFALVKASSVILFDAGSGVRLSTRNQLAGTVKALTPGAVNAEVVVALANGTEITAIVTNGSVQNLGLVVGKAITAAFKASSVIVGVQGGN
jgi:molybdate transport system regulatory protein